jgi:thiamine kinase-like enzyme
MEYLENYTTLSEDANASRTITSLLQDMTKYIYHSRTKIGGQQWLQKHIDEKILPNLNDHSITHDIDKIINSDVVTINKKQYFGIKKSLEGIDKLGVEPAFLTPIHGDLTFENILVNDHGSIKLIDMDGSDVLDAPELDLGKLCQSALASYETWRTANLAVQVDGSNYICDDKYWQIRFDIDTTQSIINSGCSILNTTPSQVWTKCIFYMSLHFIRLAPFARKISEEHYTYAFLMACVWLSNLRERQFCYA